MKTTFRVFYKLLIFILLFFLLGTLFVYIETVAIEENIETVMDESGILQKRYEKSIIPVVASTIISFIFIFQTPWFKRKSV